MEIKLNLEPESYCCEYSLLSDMLNTLEYVHKNKTDHFSSITVLAHEYTIEKLLKAICRIDFENADAELSFHHLDYNFPDFDGEYAFLLTLEDCFTREFTVSVEKAIHADGGYNVYNDQDYLYIEDTCSDELIKKHLQYEDIMDIFYIDEECEEPEEEFNDECDGDCENCTLHDEELDQDEEAYELHADLYDVIESMVEEILEERFTRR